MRIQWSHLVLTSVIAILDAALSAPIITPPPLPQTHKDLNTLEDSGLSHQLTRKYEISAEDPVINLGHPSMNHRGPISVLREGEDRASNPEQVISSSPLEKPVSHSRRTLIPLEATSSPTAESSMHLLMFPPQRERLHSPKLTAQSISGRSEASRKAPLFRRTPLPKRRKYKVTSTIEYGPAGNRQTQSLGSGDVIRLSGHEVRIFNSGSRSYGDRPRYEPDGPYRYASERGGSDAGSRSSHRDWDDRTSHSVDVPRLTDRPGRNDRLLTENR